MAHKGTNSLDTFKVSLVDHWLTWRLVMLHVNVVVVLLLVICVVLFVVTAVMFGVPFVGSAQQLAVG